MIAQHYFSKSQWALPTKENYTKLRECFNSMNHGGEYLRKDYEDLRKDYEDLRRPFTVTADVPYTDVWDFPTVSYYPDKHPCEKPAPMLEHIITASSKPDAVILDCFMGSGSTAIAAKKLGRGFIGIELDEKYYKQACRNIEDAQRQQVMAL